MFLIEWFQIYSRVLVEVFEFHDDTGVICRLFLHFCGYIEDYPASSNAIDIMEQMACVPCSYCAFRQKKAAKISRYNSLHRYTTRRTPTPVAWRNWSHFVFQLGMKVSGIKAMEEAGKWPLPKIAIDLSKVQYNISKTVDGEPLGPAISIQICTTSSLLMIC